jgi:hypothetical protein
MNRRRLRVGKPAVLRLALRLKTARGNETATFDTAPPQREAARQWLDRATRPSAAGVEVA